MIDEPGRASSPTDPFVRVRGAREHNLRDVDVDLPGGGFIEPVRTLAAEAPDAPADDVPDV